MQQTEKKQVKALIELLNRETGAQALLLRGELARIMKEQPALLHEVIENDFHSSVPASLVHAIEEVRWEELEKKLQHFSEKINPSLEEALAVVTRFVNPAVDRQEITQELDLCARQLRPVIMNCLSAEDILKTFSRFFFNVQCLLVLPSAKDIKDISFGRFLEKRRGTALCLCCLYALCAERFGLDMGVVDLAGRLLVSFQPSDGTPVLFADPLAQGNILSLQDCKNYIDSRNLEWSESFTLSLSSRAVLRRFFGNMIFILNKLRDERRLTYLRRYMDILKN